MNTAGRLLSICQQLVGSRHSKNTPMIQVWARVFDLSPESVQLEKEVTACLLAVRAELELLRVKLLGLGLSQIEAHAGLDSLRSASSPTALTQGSHGLLNNLALPHHQLTFIWANWALREENEEDARSEKLTGLHDELDSLERNLREAEITVYLRDFIQRQVFILRSALRSYKVRGIKPVEEALESVGGALKFGQTKLAAEAEGASPSARVLVQQTCVIIKHTAELADAIAKHDAGTGWAYTVADRLHPMLLSWNRE